MIKPTLFDTKKLGKNTRTKVNGQKYKIFQEKLEADGKPSTWLPPGRLVEHIRFTFIFVLLLVMETHRTIISEDVPRKIILRRYIVYIYALFSEWFADPETKLVSKEPSRYELAFSICTLIGLNPQFSF